MAETLPIPRKEQIRNVAQILFREKGYAATSMRDLAASIGIEPASLYSHIKSKEDILKEICFRIADDFFSAIEPLKGSADTPTQILRQAIIAHVSVITQNLDASAVFLHDWRYLTEKNLSVFKQLRKDYENFFLNVINAGIASGDFRNSGQKFMVLALFSSLNWIYDWYQPKGNMTPQEIGEKLGDIILNGFKENTSQ